MRIFITTMDEPLYTNPFIKKVLDSHRDEIIGVAVSKGNPLSTRNLKMYIESFIAMIIIMGIADFLKHSMITISFRIFKYFSRYFPFIRSPSILVYAKKMNIPCFDVKSVNSPMFLDVLRKTRPDIIINQAQEILKDEFLSIPKIGCLNRHNSLLPHHRGRFSSFWVLYNGEAETGVTIHFVTTRIDAGRIIVQKKIVVDVRDTFLSLTKKCYAKAGEAMLEALQKLEKRYVPGARMQIKQKSNYNPLPSIKHALKYHGLIQRRKRTQYG